MSSSEPSSLPKAPSPDNITLGIVASTYEFGGTQFSPLAVKLYLLSHCSPSYPCHIELVSPSVFACEKFLISKYFVDLQLDNNWIIVVVLTEKFWKREP